MAAITASMVKELREMTGAGMMDVKENIALSTDFWNSRSPKGPYLPNSGTSSGSTEQTIPALAHRELRPEPDIPFRTSSPPEVTDGTRMPPGHIQKLNTPLPSTCSTREYSAAGIHGWYLP